MGRSIYTAATVTCHRPRAAMAPGFFLFPARPDARTHLATGTGARGQPQLGDRAEKVKPKSARLEKAIAFLFRLFSSSPRHAAMPSKHQAEGRAEFLASSAGGRIRILRLPRRPGNRIPPHPLPPFLRQSPFSPMAYKSRRRRPPCPHHHHHHHNLAWRRWRRDRRVRPR